MPVFRSILGVVDIKEDCTAVMERAVTLAENNQANLTIVSTFDRITAGIGLPDGGPISADLRAAVDAHHRKELEQLANRYRHRIPIQTKALCGNLYLETIRQVLSNGHDLVIKSPEKVEWIDRLFSSEDMNLLRKCPCPVWMVKPQQKGTSYKSVLVAVDVDIDDSRPQTELEVQNRLNQEILEIGTYLAISDFAELHIVHTWEAIGESMMGGAFIRMPEKKILDYVNQVKKQHEAKLKEFLREFKDSQPSNNAVEYADPKLHLIKGSARREIPALAKQLEADVIVMGTVARTGIPGFLMGNTAETILNQIDCSVLAVKPPGFETTVTIGDS